MALAPFSIFHTQHENSENKSLTITAAFIVSSIKIGVQGFDSEPLDYYITNVILSDQARSP